MLLKPIILLDTPIVAGSFAVSKKGPHVENEKIIWKQVVIDLAKKVSDEYLIRVPTPVCYELMSMNREWYHFISTSTDSVFRFAKHPISNEILGIAAEYSFSANSVYVDGEKQKMKTMDPIIAAHSIQGGHYLLTTNQHDFPESHFSVVDTKVLTLEGKHGKYRSVVYLLKPHVSKKTI